MGRSIKKRMQAAFLKASKAGKDFREDVLKSDKTDAGPPEENKSESIDSILELLKKYGDERDAMCSICIFSDGDGFVKSHRNGFSHTRFSFKSIEELKYKLDQ